MEIKMKNFNNIINSLAEMFGGEVIDEEDAKLIKCKYGVEFKASVSDGIFKLEGRIPDSYGDLRPLYDCVASFEQSIFFRDIEEVIEQILRNLHFSIGDFSPLTANYQLDEAFIYVLNSLNVQRVFKYEDGFGSIKFRFHKPENHEFEEICLDDLEKYVKEAYKKKNRITSNAVNLSDIKSEHDLINVHLNNPSVLEEHAESLFGGKSFNLIYGIRNRIFLDKEFVETLMDDVVFKKFKFLYDYELAQPAYDKYENPDGSLVVLIKDEFTKEKCEYPTMYKYISGSTWRSKFPIPSMFFNVFKPYLKKNSVIEHYYGGGD